MFFDCLFYFWWSKRKLVLEKNKTRIIKDYDKLSEDIKEQIKLVYPEGYSQYLIEFKNAQGELVSALPFETFDIKYMVRMSVRQANSLVDNDPDYDDEGNLKRNARKKYEDEHSDIDYLTENESYEEDFDFD